MTEPPDQELELFARIDQEATRLATDDAALAADPIAAILDLVRRTPGHQVRDHAYKALREARQRQRDELVQERIRNALDELESLARPAAEAAAPATEAEPGPAAPPPPPRESVTVDTMVAGARYRVVRDFLDFDGTPFRAGTVLTFVDYSYFPYDGGYTIRFAEAGMRLAEIAPDNEPVLANAGNSYFAPIDP